MKDFVQNVIHDNKGFDDTILFEFIIYQSSNKFEQWFMKDVL